MKSSLPALLDIEFPIFAFSHCRDVVVAVSKAGGLGVLGAVAHSPEALERDLDWIDTNIGGRPYGIDVLVPGTYQGKSEGGLSRRDVHDVIPQAHRDFVNDILTRYDVPRLEHSIRERRETAPAPLSGNQAAQLLDVAFQHPIRIVANGLGPPPPELVGRSHAQGAVVAALAGTKHHAQISVTAGADIIIAQGYEAGGHTGEIASMVLIPEVVDAVAPVPVLAAGGIGSGRQMAAAIALGAQGVWCGSIWLTTNEAETHPTVKKKLLDATSSDTIRSRSISGKPARQLKSAWTSEWDRVDTPNPLPMPLQILLTQDAIKSIERAAHKEGSGAAQLVNYFVGQIVGQMNQIKPAGQVVVDMATEFISVLNDLSEWIDGN
jgi:NAD(P)H-dependent flavin oxidoreductase YrpB (nitropropane dioxygenase family)